jgi:ArsR family transcriptional regulator, arsenate/arsenite/antimonite-responsive transcriptional repressor
MLGNQVVSIAGELIAFGNFELTGLMIDRQLADEYIQIFEYAVSKRKITMPPVDTQPAAELLKAFSHPTRLAILQELVAGPKCVTDIEDLVEARQANISQHLSVLRYARLVDYAQDGALRCYYLCRPKLVKDMLTLVERDEPVIKRTAEQIQTDKERLAKLLAQKGRTKSPARSKVSR